MSDYYDPQHNAEMYEQSKRNREAKRAKLIALAHKEMCQGGHDSYDELQKERVPRLLAIWQLRQPERKQGHRLLMQPVGVEVRITKKNYNHADKNRTRAIL